MTVILRFWVFLVLIASLSSFAGAHGGDDHSHQAERADPADELVIDNSLPVVPWTHLNLNNNPAAFQFAVVTDRTGGLRPGVFSQAVDKLNLLQPEFVVSVGDLIEGYSEDRAELQAQWNEFDKMVQRLDMPFFYLPGNHDYSNPVMAEIWRERYGKSYYHFMYRDVLFVMLNSNDGGSTHSFSSEQIEWLRTTLQNNPGPKWTLVFTHAPMWDREEPGQWQEIEALLQDRPYTVFAGHHHRYVKHQRHGRNYFTLATTGGISSMRGTRFGEFDHVVWITMSDEGPVIANLLLDGILDENLRTEKMRDRQEHMIDRGRLAAPALLHRGDFTSAEAALRLLNDADIPYTLTAEFSARAGFAFIGESPQIITVPPNEVRLLPVQIRRVQPLQDNQNAIDIDWQLEYQHGDETIEYQGQRTIAVSREYPIAEVDQLALDGRLNDWQKVPFFRAADIPSEQRQNWQGADDADFHWAVAQTGDYLVLAIRVRDDDIVRAPAQSREAGDELIIWLDARPKQRRLLNPTFDNRVPGARQFRLQPATAGLSAELTARPEAGAVWHKVQMNSAGYSAEIAIPLALLDEDQGGGWDGVRLNVQMRDVDRGEQGALMRQWLPAWGSSGAVAGAGSFHP